MSKLSKNLRQALEAAEKEDYDECAWEAFKNTLDRNLLNESEAKTASADEIFNRIGCGRSNGGMAGSILNCGERWGPKDEPWYCPECQKKYIDRLENFIKDGKEQG